ncbi:hypothetical protein cce_2190 [Crocosphaera subtropica ATCC 51142]|uniref:Uncharacterized protein n=1 Tax=Crocosphaera subtropica (strain ATCC 51142 / BH68) TaxID=43989 RepID=B1WPH0_CROS5|nr:hypothetical protein [Crocosphaera subtropica]ACB51540.1 hypothetical protein cce_2190 [Crocosphaera subtropica ATCC 51142]
MQNTSITHSDKLHFVSLQKIKNTLFGFTLFLTCFHPSLVFAQYNYEIQQLQQLRADYQLQMKNLQTEMGTYMITNPKASAAVLASGVGFAGILSKNLNGTAKVVIAGVGLIGVNHCLDANNRQHCATVFANLNSYATQLNNYDEQINLIDQQINYLQR